MLIGKKATLFCLKIKLISFQIILDWHYGISLPGLELFERWSNDNPLANDAVSADFNSTKVASHNTVGQDDCLKFADEIQN
jgi:hypothetical protein